jgi:hypothetical protein
MTIRKGSVQADNHVFFPGIALITKVIISKYYTDVPTVSKLEVDSADTETLDA